MNILFWMDSIESINPKKDTTYLLIHECFKQNMTPYFINSIGMEIGKLIIEANEFIPFEIGNSLEINPQKLNFTQKDISAIWLRKDPPVNSDYVRELLLLNQFNQEIKLINSPTGILMNNEKLAATQFKSITPKTLISQSKKQIKDFININKNSMIKPLDSYGGNGIFKVSDSEANLDTIIEVSTKNETEQIICQQMVNYTLGDKRILLLNGEAIGAVKRINHNGHRNNFMAGGIAEKSMVSENDNKIVQLIKPFIQKNNLFFVGIDIIDNHLIEINVTSPTGLQEINYFGKIQLQQKIIAEMIKMIEKTNV